MRSIACLPRCTALQVLSDVVESLIGAVYVDSRGDLDVTWRVAQAGMPTPCLCQQLRHAVWHAAH